MKEVKYLNPRFDCTDIRGTLNKCVCSVANLVFLEAAYRYYRTKCEEESNKRKGMGESLKVASVNVYSQGKFFPHHT